MTSSNAPKKPLVVLVDDDERVVRSLTVALRRLYDLRAFTKASEAMEFITSNTQIDVIVSDIKMPEHDGFWLFRQVAMLRPHIPFIFNSAYQSTMTSEDVHMGLKPFGYLPKTGSLDDFLTLVESALRSRSGGQ